MAFGVYGEHCGVVGVAGGAQGTLSWSRFLTGQSPSCAVYGSPFKDSRVTAGLPDTSNFHLNSLSLSLGSAKWPNCPVRYSLLAYIFLMPSFSRLFFFYTSWLQQKTFNYYAHFPKSLRLCPVAWYQEQKHPFWFLGHCSELFPVRLPSWLLASMI